MKDLLTNLNSPQREAVTHDGGPLLVLAGAGSGKTRVLTHRFAHLHRIKRVPTTEITAVTFTNKAAREMRERVESLLGGELRGGFVGTFHRWALDLLRRWPEAAGLKRGFAILDSDEQRTVMNRCLKLEQVDPKTLPPRAVLGTISNQVNQGRSLADYEADMDGPDGATTVRLWRRYRAVKKASGSVDFDDMLALALRVLESDDDIRRRINRRCRFLLVDEFQDTNKLQMSLLDTALGDERQITAVGDEDQSIYRWRGAEMDNILDFEKHFPGAHVVTLEENYRSTQPILSAASTLINNNKKRRGKTLFTNRPGGEPVRFHLAYDERAEASWVTDRMEELHGRHRLSDMAVLVRTNAQTRPFEEEFTRRRLPHRVVGGLRFWQRAEVKDALAYLRLVINPDDDLAFQRVVNVPARGIGAVTVDALRKHAEATGLTLPAAAMELPESLTKRARIALERFFSILEDGRERLEEETPGELTRWLLEASGLLAMYEGTDDDKVTRRENLAQLVSAVSEGHDQGQSIADLLDAVALMSDADTIDDRDALSIMTLHAAKGLEFDIVVLAGLEDGLLPHASSRDDDDGLEEERRLAYVGMTRARRWLALTAARSRFLFGDRKQTLLSRFLMELPINELEGAASLDSTPAPIDRPVQRTFSSGVTSSHTGSAPPRQPQSRPMTKKPTRFQATATDGSGQGWRPGERVRHRRFGTGVVLSCQGRGAQLKLVIYFDKGGRKTLVPTIAQLEKA